MSKWHAYSNLGIDHIEAAGSRNNAANTRGRPFAKGNQVDLKARAAVQSWLLRCCLMARPKP